MRCLPLMVAAMLASCHETKPGTVTIIGDWSIPGFGDIHLDGTKATTIQPKGDCGFSEGCSRPTLVTGYTATRNGNEYDIAFDATSIANGVRSGYQDTIVHNEVDQNHYGTLRLRKRDDCQFIEIGNDKLMRSLSSSCPSEPLVDEVAERSFVVTLRPITKEEGDIAIGTVTRVSEKGIEPHHVVHILDEDRSPGSPVYATTVGVDGTRLTTVGNAIDYDLPVGRPMRVYGTFNKGPSGIGSLRITGIAGRKDGILRRYEIERRGPSSWVVQTYREGHIPAAVDLANPAAWTDGGCGKVAFIGREIQVNNGDPRRIAALRRLPGADDRQYRDSSFNGIRCQSNQEGSMVQKRRAAQWWIVARSVDSVVLADAANVSGSGDGVQLPIVAGAANPKATASQPIEADVPCPGRTQPLLPWEMHPRSFPLPEAARTLSEAISTVVCMTPSEWPGRGAVPVLTPMSRYLEAQSRHPGARPDDVMRGLAWSQPLPEDDPIYRNTSG